MTLREGILLECTLLKYTLQRRILQDRTLLEATLLEATLLEGTLLDMAQAMVSRPWPGHDSAMIQAMDAVLVQKVFLSFGIARVS